MCTPQIRVEHLEEARHGNVISDDCATCDSTAELFASINDLLNNDLLNDGILNHLFASSTCATTDSVMEPHASIPDLLKDGDHFVHPSEPECVSRTDYGRAFVEDMMCEQEEESSLTASAKDVPDAQCSEPQLERPELPGASSVLPRTCEECRKRKVSCSRTFPCHTCVRFSLECSVLPAARRGRPPKEGSREQERKKRRQERELRAIQLTRGNPESNSSKNASTTVEQAVAAGLWGLPTSDSLFMSST